MVLRERSLKQGQRLWSPVRWTASSPSAWCQTWIQKLWRSRLALTETAFACNTDDSNTVDTVKHRCFHLFRVFVVDASELNNSLGWDIFSSRLHWQNCLSFFFWFLIYHLQGFRLCAREVCRAGEPQQNEAGHGPWSPGLGLWLQPPTLHGWSKSHENRYRIQGMVLRALNHTKANLIYYFNLPSSCCVPQFLVWNPTWLVRAAAFQSLWPSRRPQDATSCCFQLDHLTMELTPRMKSSTGEFVTTFHMTLILTQIIYVDFDSEFLYFMFD